MERRVTKRPKKYTERDEVWVLYVPGDGWLHKCAGSWGPSHMPRNTPIGAVMFESRYAAEETAKGIGWSGAQAQKFLLETTLKEVRG